MGPHTKLRAYQASYQLGLAVIRATDRWPKREMFGLASQARRAASSIAINIAEGMAKRGRGELRRFLDISLGSLAEVEVILCMASDLEFITPAEASELEQMRATAGRLTWRLYEANLTGKDRPDTSA